MDFFLKGLISGNADLGSMLGRICAAKWRCGPLVYLGVRSPRAYEINNFLLRCQFHKRASMSLTIRLHYKLACTLGPVVNQIDFGC